MSKKTEISNLDRYLRDVDPHIGPDSEALAAELAVSVKWLELGDIVGDCYDCLPLRVVEIIAPAIRALTTMVLFDIWNCFNVGSVTRTVWENGPIKRSAEHKVFHSHHPLSQHSDRIAVSAGFVRKDEMDNLETHRQEIIAARTPQDDLFRRHLPEVRESWRVAIERVNEMRKRQDEPVPFCIELRAPRLLIGIPDPSESFIAAFMRDVDVAASGLMVATPPVQALPAAEPREFVLVEVRATARPALPAEIAQSAARTVEPTTESTTAPKKAGRTTKRARRAKPAR